MSDGNVVFLIVSLVLVFAFTSYMMWTMIKGNRLRRELMQLLKDAQAKDESPAAGRQPEGDSSHLSS
jgi:hypothetical protein